MKIGIDIDDTITNSTKTIREYVQKYDSYYCDDKHLLSSVESIIRGFLTDEDTKRFFNDHCLEIGNDIEVKENVKEVIDRLRSEGHKIYFITARSDNFYDDAQKFCEEYLAKNGIKYDKLITSKTFKVECCKEEEIDLMIDDAIDTVENVAKELGIKSLLFTSELNKDKETNIKRVNNWLEVYDYINEIA